MKYCVFWDPTNYFLTNKQHFLGLKLLSSWLSVWSHLTFAALITPCSFHTCHDPTVWKSPPDHCNKDEHPLRFLFGSICRNRRRPSIGWRWTNMRAYTQARTSLRCTVNCFNGWQGCLSSIHLSTVTGWWQTAVRMFLSSTGDSQSKTGKPGCLTH